MPFDNITTAIAMVKAQAGIDSADTTRDAYITDTLDSSKGTINGTDEYRPYLVAALTMWSSKGEQTITEASGSAKFRFDDDRMNLRPAIESNLRIQQSKDIQQGTIVPTGWDVQSFLDSLCGCQGDGDAVGSGQTYVFSTTVI